MEDSIEEEVNIDGSEIALASCIVNDEAEDHAKNLMWQTVKLWAADWHSFGLVDLNDRHS